MTPTHTGKILFTGNQPSAETKLEQLPGGGWLDEDEDRYYPNGEHHSNRHGHRYEYFRLDPESIKPIAALPTMPTGKELYARYVAFYAANNRSVDTWEELDERDRGAWEFIAERINA